MKFHWNLFLMVQLTNSSIGSDNGQLSHKTIGILANVFCTSGPNLVILAWMGDELWCGQAQNGVNFDF